jgi:hypothetical protein
MEKLGWLWPHGRSQPFSFPTRGFGSSGIGSPRAERPGPLAALFERPDRNPFPVIPSHLQSDCASP